MFEGGNNTVPITYGSIITISYPSDSNMMLFSDGLIKTRIYLRNMGQESEKKTSFYRSLFQIYPSFINTYKQEVLNLKTESEKSGPNTNMKKEFYTDLKEKLTLEYKFNLEHFEKVKNTPVSFEQSVMFLHLASNKFLSCRFLEADVEKENYKLELEDIPSEATNFKILPSYKHQKENEGMIYYNDTFYIVHSQSILNKMAYLQCNCQDLSNLNKSSATKKRIVSSPSSNVKLLPASEPKELPSPTLQTFQAPSRLVKKEVNLSLEKATRWKIALFSSNTLETTFLSYGDTIWMNHAEHNATLICKKQKDNKLEPGFVRSIVSDHFQQYVGNTNGMWIIENHDYKRGGPVQWDHSFRLKHFTSGQYLTVKFDHIKQRTVLALENTPTCETLFQFRMIPTTYTKQDLKYQKYINKEAFTLINHVASKHWLHLDLNGNVLDSYLSKDPRDDDVFKLFRANANEIWETNFLISCAPMLSNYLLFLKDVAKQVYIQ